MAAICTALAAAGYLSSNRASSAKSLDTVAQTGGQQGHREWMLVGRRVVMLHQFIKKSEKNPLNELKIARNRMKEVKDEKHS